MEVVDGILMYANNALHIVEVSVVVEHVMLNTLNARLCFKIFSRGYFLQQTGGPTLLTNAGDGIYVVSSRK